MKTIQQDLRSNNLSLDEAINVAQNGPLWRLMSAFGTTPLVVHATQEEDTDMMMLFTPSLLMFTIPNSQIIYTNMRL